MNFTKRTMNYTLYCILWMIFFNSLLTFVQSSPLPDSDRTLSTSKTDSNRLRNRTKLRFNNGSNDVILPQRLIEGATEVIVLNVSDIRWLIGDGNDRSEKNDRFIIESYVVTSRNPRVAKILNSTLVQSNTDEFMKQSIRPGDHHESPFPTWEIQSLDDGEKPKLSVKISGHRVGRTVIDISAYGYAADSMIDKQNHNFGIDTEGVTTFSSNSVEFDHQKELRFVTSFDVFVLRRSVYNRLNSAFTIFVAVITITTTFLIGTQLEWKIIIKELRKPESLLIGVGCEFILMPLVAFVLSLTLLRGNYAWQLVCLAIGATPGGGHSPFWTMTLDGNLDLAVAMSFVASVAALGILPMWLWTLGRVFYGGRVTIPYVTIMGSLFALICPIVFGLAFKHYLPIWAERIRKVLKPITIFSFVVVGIFGCAVNSYVFALLEWRHFVCGMLLPYAGFVLSYPFARWICRRNYQDSLAIAVENGCLSVAVPVVLIQLTLPQPDADLSLVVPVGIVMCASWPLWIFFIYLLVKKRFMKSPKSTDDHHEMPPTVTKDSLENANKAISVSTATSVCDISLELGHEKKDNIGSIP